MIASYSALEAGTEPEWAQSGDHQLADNRRTHIRSVMAEVGEMPRHEIIRRVLSSQPRHLLNELQETQVVDIQAFAVDTQNLTVDSFNQSLPEGTGNLPTAGTDAAKVMTDAIGDTDAQQLRAIVLLTDGRQTVPKDVLTEADRLGRSIVFFLLSKTKNINITLWQLTHVRVVSNSC